jgi:hypothetical protein
MFIFEGPINAFFVKNSTAVCGIQEKSNVSFNALQQQQIDQYKFMRKILAIFILDSFFTICIPDTNVPQTGQYFTSSFN